MKENNLNYYLAKEEIKRIFVVFNKVDKKYKNIKKNIDKYEDISYLNFSDEDKEKLFSALEKEIKEINFDATKLIFKLDEIYNNLIKDVGEFKINQIKREISSFIKLFKSNKLKVNNVNLISIYSFENKVNSELDLYNSKIKLEEYFVIDEFKNRILTYINDVKATINEISSSLKLDAVSYFDKLVSYIKDQYKVIFDSGKNKTHTIPERGKGLIFISPWVIGFLVFTLYPLIQTLIFSFSSVTPSTDGYHIESVGFTNYINLFTTDTDFMEAIRDYIIEMIIYVPSITVFSLMIAMLLNTKVKGTGFFRTIFFLPVIITSGPVMKILIEQGVTSFPGLEKVINLDEINSTLPEFLQIGLNTIVDEFIMILWFCGIQILVFLTSLQKIDKGVYEAASIDGASKWERFWKVTLPAINPTIVINVVFTIVMQSIFALNPIILKIQSDMNDTASDRGYGYASAIAFTYFLIMIAVLIIFVLIFKKHEKRVRRSRKI